MPTTPPTMTTYTGPSVTLFPSAVSRRSIGETAAAFTNPERLIGAATGAEDSFATITVPTLGGSGTVSEVLNLDYTAPSGLETVNILGWRGSFCYLTANPDDESEWVIDSIGLVTQLRTGADAVIGSPESLHGFAGDGEPLDWGIVNEYPLGSSIAGPDHISTYSSAGTGTPATSRGLLANRFDDWSGFVVYIQSISAQAYNSVLAFDTLSVEVFYVPSSGADYSTALTIADDPGITAIDAATAGIALDVLWGPEIAWVNPGEITTLKSAKQRTISTAVWDNTAKTLTKSSLCTNLRNVGDTEVFTSSGGTGWSVGAEFRVTKVSNTVGTMTNLDGSTINNANTSVSGTMGLCATATSDAEDYCGQTEFLRIPFAAGSLDGDLGHVPAQLRLTNRSSYADDFGSSTGDEPSFYVVGRAAIVRGDNTVLASDLEIILYEAWNFKVGTYAGGYPSDRTLAIDTSDLTAAQVAAINGEKFAVLLRFNLDNHLNTELESSAVLSFLGVSEATWESDDMAAPAITPAATTVSTQTAAGLVVTLPDFATHARIGAISSGHLFKNDGTTELSEGDFITEAEGTSGLKFTPGAASGVVSIPLRSAAGAGDEYVSGPSGAASIAVFSADGTGGQLVRYIPI